KILVVPRHANVLQILRHAIARDGYVEFSCARQIAAAFFVQSAVAAQSARHLAHAVGAKVEANAGIVIGDLSQRFTAIVGTNERHHKLVSHALVVGLFHPLHGVDRCATFSFAIHHCVVGFGDALPAAVAVHGIVAAVDGGDLAGVVLAHLLLQLFDVAGAVG